VHKKNLSQLSIVVEKLAKFFRGYFFGVPKFPSCRVVVGLLVVMISLELCTTYSSSSPVVTTTSIIICFKKHRLTQVHLENGC